MKFDRFFSLLVLVVLMSFSLVPEQTTASPLSQAAANTMLELQFDGNVNDSSGNNLNGTWPNGGAVYDTGHNGQAISITPDADNYVEISNSDLLGGMNQLGISVWAKKNSPTSEGALLSKGNQYRLIIGERYVSGYVFNADGVQATASNYGMNGINDTEWHHYQLGYNGAMVSLFVDGVVVAEEPLTGIVQLNSGNPPLVGKRLGNPAFDGLIDEVIITDAAPDIDVPVFAELNPAPGDTWIALDSNIVAHVQDAGTGVDAATIAMNVEGDLVTPAVTGDPVDYTLTYDPPTNFSYDQEVNVTLTATDLAGNTANQSYAFTIRSTSDTQPPQGYFYVEDQGAGQAIIHNYFQDLETGLGNGAQMRFSNDSVTWSTPEAYAPTKTWSLAAANGARTVYGNFSDAGGNWTGPITYTLDATYADDLIVIRNDPTAAHLIWREQTSASEYVVLRSDTLGWSGTIALAEPSTTSSRIINVTNTRGLQAGDELHFRRGRNDYYVAQVLDEHRLELTIEPPAYDVGAEVNLSGCWVWDYTGYSEVEHVSGNLEYVDTGLALENDYFYVIGYSNGSTITGYSNPVHARLTGTNLLYDAALGAYGGYAWKVGQTYNDTPELIDGDASSYLIRIQHSNPAITDTNGTYLGFQRVNLNDRLPIQRVEISQDMSVERTQATHVTLGFDDHSFQSFDLENEPLIVRADADGYRTYLIPVNKTSAYVSIYIDQIANPDGSYITWSKIGIYTDQRIAEPVTSAVDVTSVNLAFDFSQNDGTLPTIFGTDEVWNNTQGGETGAMLSSWKYTKDIFNLYRIQVGDFWPHAYGWNQVKLGELATNISAEQTTLTLANVATSDVSQLNTGVDLKIDYELMNFSSFSDNNLSVNDRGLDHTDAITHSAGAPVYAYQTANQILRLQEAIPEFPMIKYANAYVSGITSISQETPVTDTVRAGIITITVNQGDYEVGDVIRNGREAFLIQDVDASNPAEIHLTVQRGYDGTAQETVQHNLPSHDIYKYQDYEPYYEGFKNDPIDPANYNWEHWDVTWDKVIKDGNAIPWIIAWSPWYATQARGRVGALETISNTRGISNNVIVDEYNAAHDDTDWWYLLNDDNTMDDDSNIRGNMYEFYHARIYFLTGEATGKVFFIRSHSGEQLRVVASWDDSSWPVTNPQYIDLAAEGVQPGDAYIITHSTRNYANVAPKYREYNAEIFYNVAHHVREKYATELADRPIYIEYYLEPNLGSYGTWTVDSYVDSYNVFADVIRNGRTGLGSGLSESEVILGAGAIAGGLNPGVPMPGTDRDYDIALTLIDETTHLDFISHHRYYMGSRVQKRENSWEYWMLRTYAQSKGKDIVIIDSEDSVATAGGTGQEEARHWAKFSVPYWEANFINSYAGDYGPLGRLAFIIHFRLYGGSSTSLGMAIPDTDGSPLLDLVYWPIQMYQQHTSEDPQHPDTLALTIQGNDTYGWVQAMGTTHGQTGEKKIHLVNKKEEAVTVNLTLLGTTATSGSMDIVVGCGENQTITDGYQLPDLQNAVQHISLVNLNSVTLEPCSAGIITLHEDVPPLQLVYLPTIWR